MQSAEIELSERGLTALRLLASELSQREIGAELYSSLTTVERQMRNVFRTLGLVTPGRRSPARVGSA